MKTINEIQEVFLAKWVYEQLSLLRNQVLGPSLQMPTHALKVYDVLEPILSSLLKTEGIKDGKIIKVPSPWHAVLILESIQHHLANEGKRLVFRGQSNSEWNISSSLIREGVNEKLETLRSKLFCDLLSGMSFNTMKVFSSYSKDIDLRISSKCYEAAAQHYGIPTSLIDFSTDPAVGVFFASTTGGNRKDRVGSVFVLSLDQFFENNFEIIIPPPFIERLHIQRGFFLKAGNETIDKNTLPIFEIQFSLEYEFYPFNVVRDKMGIVDILYDSSHIKAVLKAVDSISNIEDISKIEYEEFVTSTCKSLKTAFKDVYSDPTQMWANYVNAFEDLLYWTVYYIKDNKLYADLALLDKITSTNKELVLSIIQFYLSWSSHPTIDIEKKKKFISLADLLKNSLDRIAKI